MGQVLLAVVEIFALLTAVQGLQYIAYLDDGIFANIHNCIWFIFAILGNGFGLVAICKIFFKQISEKFVGNFNFNWIYSVRMVGGSKFDWWPRT